MIRVLLSMIALATGTSFPAAIYPSPVASQGAAMSLCPSAAGLEPFTPATAGLARDAAAAYGRKSLANDLHDSDRSWWPTVRRMWRSKELHSKRWVMEGTLPAAKSGFKVFLEPACGAGIVAKTLIVTIGPPHANCDACLSHLFFVDRRGHALVYYLY